MIKNTGSNDLRSNSSTARIVKLTINYLNKGREYERGQDQKKIDDERFS
jgi:hypothetical protein